MYQRIRMLVRLLTCFLILTGVAVQRNGSIFGHDLNAPEVEATNDSSPLTRVDGAVVVNTSSIAKDIRGFGGSVPLEITIKDGVIANIEPLKNSETEDFFKRASSAIIPQWLGTSVNDVSAKHVDAVSGATLSSNALNATIQEGVAYANGFMQESDKESVPDFEFTWKFAVVLLVVVCAALLPLFVKNKYYRFSQLALNVVVLGFWSGTFLSYELFINYIANGVNVWQSLAVLLMLVTAFVYPYFGKSFHYCTWLCPLGSIQELCGKSVRYKLKLSSKAVKGLNVFQECLWFALIFIMMAGIWFDWIDYELFKAFIFKSASIGVLIAAAVVVLLSFVVQRPYCRFVCPTGCLFKITQNPDK